MRNKGLKSLALAAPAALGALVAATQAAAGPLPNSTATYSLNVTSPVWSNYTNASLPVGTQIADPDIYYLDQVGGFTETDYFGNGPIANVQVNGIGTGAISMTYSYEILGPHGASALVDLSGSVYAFAFPYPDLGGAFAGITGSVGVGPSGYYGEACASFTGGCAPNTSFGNFNEPVNVVFSVPTNTIETITLDTSVSSQDGGAEFSAQADPILSLDPSIGDPQDYQLLLSPDVAAGIAADGGGGGGDGGGVPEPATWAMLVLGFGGLGATLRRRRQPGPAAAAAT